MGFLDTIWNEWLLFPLRLLYKYGGVDLFWGVGPIASRVIVISFIGLILFVLYEVYSRRKKWRLMACPECRKEVSTQAPTCPNCGYPLERREPEPLSTDAPRQLSSFPKSQSVIGVLILSIVSLSVYFWVFLFRAIRAIEDNTSIVHDPQMVGRARTGVTWAILLNVGAGVSIVIASYSFAASKSGQLALWMAETGMPVQAPPATVAWALVNEAILVAAFLLTWKPFLDLVKGCYVLNGVELGALAATGPLILLGLISLISSIILGLGANSLHVLSVSTAEAMDTFLVIIKVATSLSLFITAVASMNRLYRTVG